MEKLYSLYPHLPVTSPGAYVAARKLWKYFLQLKTTIYCIVSWHHTLTRSLTAEERLGCSCYYWIRLSRCISFWQIKAFKVITVVLTICWISKHWMSHNSCCLFSIYTQWQTDYCPPSAQVFLRKEEGKPRGCLCLQNNGRSSSSGLLYTPWNVICCASQENRVAITSSLPTLCRIALSPTCSLTFISPGDYLLVFLTSFCNNNEEIM